mgnify:FL=1|jgi:hypothetical protein
MNPEQPLTSEKAKPSIQETSGLSVKAPLQLLPEELEERKNGVRTASALSKKAKREPESHDRGVFAKTERKED